MIIFIVMKNDKINYVITPKGVKELNLPENTLIKLHPKTPINFDHWERATLFEVIEEYYEDNNRKPDTLFAGIQDLTTNIFNCDSNNPNILEKSLYLNLPPALSDTLRQLVVFLLLRYFNTYFSSTNDCEPVDHIFPLRYVIVIDEAHIYLKNKKSINTIRYCD